MNLPLELIRIVIDAAASVFARKDLMAIRLVNSEFDKEVLLHVFKDVDLDSSIRPLITQETLEEAPASLREKYLHQRIKRHPGEMNLFAYLFLAAFERQVAELGIQQSPEAKDNLLKEWLRIPMHGRAYAWAVTHHHHQFGIALRHRIESIPGGGQVLSEDFALWLDVQITREWILGRVCHAILQNDEETLSHHFQSYQVQAMRTSYGFGTCALQFAINRGTVEVLRVILRNPRPMVHRDLYSCLESAIKSEDSQEERFRLLISPFTSSYMSARATTCMFELVRTALEDDTQMIDHMIKYSESYSHAAMRQSFLDIIFEQSISTGNEQVMKRVRPKINISAASSKWFLHSSTRY